VNVEGHVLGKHPGIQFFTIGQRRGLGLNGNTEKPLYVTRIDADSNEVVLGNSEDLFRSSLWASRVNYISGDPPSDLTDATAKIRYKASEAGASVLPLADDWAEIRFDEPQRAVTPGQAVVFYSGERILGGGYIELEAPVATPVG
jgi:tRNA-specific 2-thiouridylase